jgi:lysozyme
MSRDIPERALSFVTEHEGFRLKAYVDSVGVNTIGVGHTSPRIHPGMTITLDQAMTLLRDDLSLAARRLAAVVKPDVLAELTDNQYAAILSFVFNLGVKPDWTIWKRLNARAYDQIPLELGKFVNGTVGGRLVKISGLVNRRNAEIALWGEDEPGSVDVDLSPSQTRNMATPPTPSDPTPPGKSAVLLTSIGGSVLAAPAMVKQVSETLQPLAPTVPAINQIIGVLAVVGAILAVVGIVLIWLHKQQARS